jgi:hypothetical protein
MEKPIDNYARDIKWELTHESYIKEKFDTYQRWFMQIQDKINKIDLEIKQLNETLIRMHGEMDVHRQIVLNEVRKQEPEPLEVVELHREEQEVPEEPMPFIKKLLQQKKKKEPKHEQHTQ